MPLSRARFKELLDHYGFETSNRPPACEGLDEGLGGARRVNDRFDLRIDGMGFDDPLDVVYMTLRAAGTNVGQFFELSPDAGVGRLQEAVDQLLGMAGDPGPITCPECGRLLSPKRGGRFGPFLSCSFKPGHALHCTGKNNSIPAVVEW